MSEKNDEAHPVGVSMQYSEDRRYISLMFSSESEIEGETLIEILSQFISENMEHSDKIFDEEFAIEIGMH